MVDSLALFCGYLTLGSPAAAIAVATAALNEGNGAGTLNRKPQEYSRHII